jgi:hypothetical protein
MSDSKRDEIVGLLRDLSALLPDMRIGQLMANLATVARGTSPSAIWDMEDEELLAAARWQIAELAARGRAQAVEV